jgi:hypothetical protein
MTMRKLSVLFIVLLMVVGVTDALSQLAANPNNFNYYYFYRLTASAGRAYLTNTTDTLPNTAINGWLSGGSKTIDMGGASFAGIRFINSDSCYAYIYVDALQGTTWANVYTDSVEVDAADSVEILLRGVATERLGGTLHRKLRFRVNFQNVTQGVTSALYRFDVLWKP